MAKYDIAQIKADAEWHWPYIINQVAGIGDDHLITNHGPCPKCGGADRWRVFDDFSQTGGAICNQCGKFGDGLAVIQWYTGLAFPAVVQKLGQFLGTTPIDAARERNPVQSPAPLVVKQKPEPHEVDIDGMTAIEIFEHSPQTDGTIQMWCSIKRGLSFDAVRLMGAKVGKYRKRHRVIAFPVWNVAGHHIGWTIYESGGGYLPQFKAGSSDPVAWLKVKTIKAKDTK